MKKTVLMIGLLVAVTAGVFAQISVAGQEIKYKLVAITDAINGKVNYNVGERITTITFTANSCNGVSTKGPFIYQGEQNNMFVFKYTYDWGNGAIEEETMFFSKDFRQLTIRWFYSDRYFTYHRRFESDFSLSILKDMNRQIDVYERVDPPKAPDRMY
jgi:hypothetical protein